MTYGHFKRMSRLILPRLKLVIWLATQNQRNQWWCHHQDEWSNGFEFWGNLFEEKAMNMKFILFRQSEWITGLQTTWVCRRIKLKFYRSAETMRWTWVRSTFNLNELPGGLFSVSWNATHETTDNRLFSIKIKALSGGWLSGISQTKQRHYTDPWCEPLW